MVNAAQFMMDRERLADNKRHSLRRTIEQSLLQGLISCKKCGYALYRTSTRTSTLKIHYYRFLGSDGWCYQNNSQCNCRPIRQDLLDDLVWTGGKALEDPALINAELNRRLTTAQTTYPTKRQQETLKRDLARVNKSMERLKCDIFLDNDRYCGTFFPASRSGKILLPDINRISPNTFAFR